MPAKAGIQNFEACQRFLFYDVRMKTAYILHGITDAHEYLEMGFPSPSNAHWIPWLQQKFLRAGILCQTPEMPNPHMPNYQEWAKTFSQAQLKEDSTIVAHSAGCGFILKWLHKNPSVKLEKLLLVAPWLDPQNVFQDFLQFNFSPDLSKRIGELHVFYSEDEPVDGVKNSKETILNTYPNTKLHIYFDKRHFCLNDTGPTFDDLWNVCNS